MIDRMYKWIFLLAIMKGVISDKLRDHGSEIEIHHVKREELNGLEYLGIGYNVRESMPLGNEEEVVIDPGYKEPVISFDYKKGGPNENGPPKGVWIRREELCNKTILISKGKKNESWEDVFKEDIKVNILGSDMYSNDKFKENIKKVLKVDEANIYKINCSIHTTGMILSQKWKLKESILIMLERLERLVNEEKGGVREEWREVFARYGTHVMTKMSLGGKIVEITNEKEVNSREDETKENKSQIEVAIFNMNLNYEKKKEEEGVNRERYKKVLIIGGSASSKGENEIDKKGWIGSIRENPVPIKFELTPLGYFIHQNFKSERLLKSYEENLREYVK